MPRLLTQNKPMNLEKWFPTPIWYDFLNQDWKAIKERCLQLEAEDTQQMQLSNIGGWHSPDLAIHDDPVLKPLFKDIQEKLKNVSAQIDHRFDVEITSAWVIINRGKAYNAKHYHPESALSGVIYVHADDNSGHIGFIRGDLKQHYPINTFDSDLFNEEVTFKPEIGKLVVFPSWVYHYVNSNADEQSNEARISIAFNTRQVNKPDQAHY